MKKIISLTLIFFITSCTSASQFGAGVNITFDPRTIGMQIDDTIMQKNLNARLALADKKYFISIQSEVLDGRIFLSGKVDEPEEKINAVLSWLVIRISFAVLLKLLWPLIVIAFLTERTPFISQAILVILIFSSGSSTFPDKNILPSRTSD